MANNWSSSYSTLKKIKNKNIDKKCESIMEPCPTGSTHGPSPFGAGMCECEYYYSETRTQRTL